MRQRKADADCRTFKAWVGAKKVAFWQSRRFFERNLLIHSYLRTHQRLPLCPAEFGNDGPGSGSDPAQA
jgi:hypothetical protein